MFVKSLIKSAKIVTLLFLTVLTFNSEQLAQTNKYILTSCFDKINTESLYGLNAGIKYASLNLPAENNSALDYADLETLINHNKQSGYKPLYVGKQLIASLKLEGPPIISLKTRTADAEPKNENDESFFSSDLFVFIGAAAITTAFYFIWSDDDNTVSKKTFGIPPKP